MKREIKELKRIARGNLQGNFLGLIRALIFCNLIVSLIETPFSMMTNEIAFSPTNILYYVAVLLITIASVVLTVGQYCLHLRVARDGKLHLSELFYPLRYDANRLIATEAILYVVRMIGLAPIIGAIVIISYYDSMDMYMAALGLVLLGGVLTICIELTFGLIYFVLIDNEELSGIACIKKAISMIKGHKRRLLYLWTSFLGILLLALPTLGLALLWIHPYMMQTTTVFYMDITGELDEVLEKRRAQKPTPEPVVIDSYV